MGELGRLGHGLQRSYLLSILEELADNDAENAPKLLIALEEPELFQHPPQAQNLAEVLQKLALGNSQVFVCTHSPYFVSGKGVEDVRLVRKPRGSARSIVSQMTFKALAEYLTKVLGELRYKEPVGVQAKIHQALQPVLKEMFFAPALVLVEGLEDMAFILSAFHLLGLWDSWRRHGAHIVPVSGKSELIQPLAIGQLMKMPIYVIFDADGDEAKPENKGKHKRDNERLLKLLGQPTHSLFPSEASWQDLFVTWPSNFGIMVAGDYDPDEWTEWKRQAEGELGQPGNLDKNSIFIATVLCKAWKAGKPSKTLTTLCNKILKFAEAAQA